MGRKTQHIDKFVFTVKAKDLDCKQVIVEKAKDREVNIKKGRRPKLRFYFACSGDKWRRFYAQIKNLCTVELPVICPTPNWLRRTILKNLGKTAANRFNPVRARKAASILAAISAESAAVRSQSITKVR